MKEFISKYPIQITISSLIALCLFLVTVTYKATTAYSNVVARTSALEKMCVLQGQVGKKNSEDIDRQELLYVEVVGQLNHITAVVEDIRNGLKR